jgi:hypothetical protein
MKISDWLVVEEATLLELAAFREEVDDQLAPVEYGL